MLLWLDNSPVFDPANPQTFDPCVKLINTYIQCTADEGSTASNFINKQTHRHTHTYYRTAEDSEKKKCRFNIPYPPMNETCILTPSTKEISDPETRKTRLSKYQELLEFLRNYNDTNYDEEPRLEDILQKLSIESVDEYKSIIRTAIKRPTVYLKRSIKNRMVSAFNSQLLSLWQSNMDIQFILDVYSCVRYVIEYIGKSQKGISKLMREIVESFKSSSANLTVQQQLSRLGSSFAKAQEISAQEAVYTCLGLKQSNTSTGHIWINTSHPDKRTRILKSKAQRKNLDPQSTDIFQGCLIEHYPLRPEHFKNLTLAEFAAEYEIVTKKAPTEQCDSSSNDDDNSDDETENVEIIGDTKLIGKEKFLHKRRKRKIIRYVKFNLEKNADDFNRERIMLFHPWRNEKKDLLDVNCKEIYDKNYEDIHRLWKQFNKINEDDLTEEIINDVQEESDGRTNDNTNDWVPDEELVTDLGDVDELDKINDGNTEEYEVTTNFKIHKIDDGKYNDLIGSLNQAQRQFLYHVTSLLRQQIYDRGVSSLRVCVTGPAGTGKSVVIRAITQATVRILNLRPDIDDLTFLPILLLAPTGKASYNIQGLTIHSALRIPVNQFVGLLSKLSDDELGNFRSKYRNLKIIIIDEFSMVGIKLFSFIDQRLRLIMGNNLPFGGINIIVFGYFYQLPPVRATAIYTTFDELLNKHPSNLQIISAKMTWESFKFYELTEIMRQKDDTEFAEMLNKLAQGTLEKNDIDFFKSLERDIEIKFDTDILHRWGSNAEVDSMNSRVLKLHKVPGVVSEAINIYQLTRQILKKQKIREDKIVKEYHIQ